MCNCLHAGLYQTDFPKLWSAGVQTIAHLAELSPEALAAIVRRTAKAVAPFPALAKARVQNAPVVIGALYAPAAPRVYFDIETDPWGGNKLCWLIGVLDEGTGEFRQFFAKTPRQEKRVLRQFAEHCGDQLRGRMLSAYSG